MKNVPCWPDVVVATEFVSIWRTVMLAPGRAPPWLSSTVPRSVPSAVWAPPEAAADDTARSTPTTSSRIRLIYSQPFTLEEAKVIYGARVIGVSRKYS